MAKTLLFDGDCGFCTTSAGWAKRIAPGVAILPWQRVDLSEFGVTAQDCAASVQWIDTDEPAAVVRSAGAAAVAEVLTTAGGLWAAAGRTMQLPVVRVAAEWVYQLVARNRHRLPGGTPACRLP